MMRSLWSGVSGLQAHQIAMDVEGNNIANVNTYGFKYNRANFADILSQTPRVATAPQGQLGGQNAMQIGLGTTINSTTRIFSQGTLTATCSSRKWLLCRISRWRNDKILYKKRRLRP